MSASRRHRSSSRSGASGSQLWPLVAAAGAAAAIVAVGLVVFGRGHAFTTPAADSVVPPSSMPLPPLGELPEAPVADWQAAETLADAIAATMPRMADTTDRLDEGSAQLALWASQHLKWSDLSALPETSPALYRKDPREERGKRLCGSGTIQVVRAERNLARRLESDRPLPLPAPPAAPSVGIAVVDPLQPAAPESFWEVPEGNKVFFAVIEAADPDGAAMSVARRPGREEAAPLVLSVIAARSTGRLVDGDQARVCGVLTGVNVIRGGTNDQLAHRLVGMFDLPENH